MNVYHVSFHNIRWGSRTYGILCMPKAPGKYPALLRVPGAGIGPYYGDIQTAEKGAITLEIGVHGIPVNLTQDFISLSTLDYPSWEDFARQLDRVLVQQVGDHPCI